MSDPAPSVAPVIQIDVVSDVVCPWCYIGKRHLDVALREWLASGGTPVAVHWQPYVLNPDTPPEGEPYRPFLERKFGGAQALEAIWARVREAGRGAGIPFAFERIQTRPNTLAAHALLAQAQAAEDVDVNGLVEALFAAHFVEGQDIGSPKLLQAIAERFAGSLSAHWFDWNEATFQAVQRAAAHWRERGVAGVPYFVFQRRLAVSGAQPPAVLRDALQQAAID